MQQKELRIVRSLMELRRRRRYDNIMYLKNILYNE